MTEENSYSRMRALVVDDKKTMRKILYRMLSSIGLTEIDEAEEGREALQLIENNDYDVIVLDWVMPGMNGRETIRNIRRRNFWQTSPPIIVMSAILDAKCLQEAVEDGVLFFLFKPFSEAALKERLRVLQRLSLMDRFSAENQALASEPITVPIDRPTTLTDLPQESFINPPSRFRHGKKPEKPVSAPPERNDVFEI